MTLPEHLRLIALTGSRPTPPAPWSALDDDERAVWVRLAEWVECDRVGAAATARAAGYAAGQEAMRKRAEAVVRENQEAYRDRIAENDFYLKPRMQGNLTGLSFATAIAALPVEGES